MAITSLHAVPWNVELTEPFGIATGVQHVAANVLVTVVLDDCTRLCDKFGDGRVEALCQSSLAFDVVDVHRLRRMRRPSAW